MDQTSFMTPAEIDFEMLMALKKTMSMFRLNPIPTKGGSHSPPLVGIGLTQAST